MNTQQVADRFNELAQQEKWFEIQDDFFAHDVKSIDPEGSPYFGYAEGKAAVRKKGEDLIKTVEAVHSAYTSTPVVAGDYFAVGREIDFTLRDMGRVQLHQIMMYKVIGGKIVSEQFYY